MAVHADRHDLADVRRVQRADRAHDGGPPRARVLLGPARTAGEVDREAGTREPEQPAVERHQTRLDLVRAEIEPEDRAFPGRHRRRRAVAGGADSASSTTASAVATSVTSVRTTPARRAPRMGLTLASPAADADGDRHAPEPARIEGDDPVPQGRADEPSLRDRRGRRAPPRRRQRSRAGVRSGRPRRTRTRPGRRSRTGRRRAAPTGRAPPGRLRGRRANGASPRRRRGPGPSGRAAWPRTPRRRAGRARVPGRSSSSRRTTGRRSRRPGWPPRPGRRPWPTTDAPSPTPTTEPPRTASRSTAAASRPTIRRVRSSGPATDRREVHRIEPEPVSECGGSGTLDRGRVVDADLDDALRPGPLEQPRDLRAGDTEQLGDRVLGLAQLVVEAARADELLDVAHRRPPGRCTDVLNRCAGMSRASWRVGHASGKTGNRTSGSRPLGPARRCRDRATGVT